jgi:hypothetical protein
MERDVETGFIGQVPCYIGNRLYSVHTSSDISYFLQSDVTAHDSDNYLLFILMQQEAGYVSVNCVL